MIPNMKAIEYNMLMTLGAFMAYHVPLLATDYCMSGMSIDIITAYAKDLTKFTKPSIIIQKVHTQQSSIGFGNVLGQYYDVDDNREYDVSGRVHDMIIQFNVNGNTQTQCTLLTSLICEGILNKLDDADSGVILTLKDFVQNINEPTDIGRMDLCDNLDIMYMGSNDNKDYMSAVRAEFRTVQSIIHNTSEYVDLSKKIKYTQTIKL